MWLDRLLRYGRAPMPHRMSGTSKPLAGASQDHKPDNVAVWLPEFVNQRPALVIVAVLVADLCKAISGARELSADFFAVRYRCAEANRLDRPTEVLGCLVNPLGNDVTDDLSAAIFKSASAHSPSNLTAAPFMSGDTAAYALIRTQEALFNQLLLRHDVHQPVINLRNPFVKGVADSPITRTVGLFLMKSVIALNTVWHSSTINNSSPSGEPAPRQCLARCKSGCAHKAGSASASPA